MIDIPKYTPLLLDPVYTHILRVSGKIHLVAAVLGASDDVMSGRLWMEKEEL